tara:strand:- start:420 stop:626 length:207 start_codon:yes stop_codon:yes gene_type:complete
MSQSLKYLRDLTERLLSCESPKPCIDLKNVSKGLKCSKEILKNKISDIVSVRKDVNGVIEEGEENING